MCENNTDYSDELNQATKNCMPGSATSQISMSISMGKVLTIVAEYGSSRNQACDSVYLGRPDVLLRKHINLERGAVAEEHMFITPGSGVACRFPLLDERAQCGHFLKDL